MEAFLFRHGACPKAGIPQIMQAKAKSKSGPTPMHIDAGSAADEDGGTMDGGELATVAVATSRASSAPQHQRLKCDEGLAKIFIEESSKEVFITSSDDTDFLLHFIGKVTRVPIAGCHGVET